MDRQTISQRAMARPITDSPRNVADRDRLREEWRLLALEWSALQDAADRLDEGRKILLDECTLRLIEAGMPVTKAEKEARTSEQYRGYVRKLHDAKRSAQDARIAMQNADRLYWEAVSVEATTRAELRISR
jgi:hypothetical protein